MMLSQKTVIYPSLDIIVQFGTVFHEYNRVTAVASGAGVVAKVAWVVSNKFKANY